MNDTIMMIEAAEWTPEASDKLISLLDKIGYAPDGEGPVCSISAINMALHGRAIEQIPLCMSEVIGRWLRVIEFAMPKDRLNGARWRALLPGAAGSGRQHEAERLEIIVNWLWDTVIPFAQHEADCLGFGDCWRRMCRERTSDAIRVAMGRANLAWLVAFNKTDKQRAAATMHMVAYYGFSTVDAVNDASRKRVRFRSPSGLDLQWASDAAWAAHVASELTKDLGAYWNTVDPEGLLERLIEGGQ